MTARSPEEPVRGIGALRHVASKLEVSGDPVLIGHAAALRRYEEEARLGTTLDDALGVASRGGAGPWWVQEARARRDEAIRHIYAAFYANHDVADAADEIARLAARRMMSQTPASNNKEILVDVALRTGVKFPGRQRLRELLR